MTKPTTPPVIVEQEDRERAADAVKAYRGQKNGNWQARIRRGECDDGEMVQAFARARLSGHRAGVEEERKRCAEIARDVRDDVAGEYDDRSDGYRDACDEVARRIEQLAISLATDSAGESGA